MKINFCSRQQHVGVKTLPLMYQVSGSATELCINNALTLRIIYVSYLNKYIRMVQRKVTIIAY